MVIRAPCAQLLLLPRTRRSLSLAAGGRCALAVSVVLLPLYPQQRPLRAPQELQAAQQENDVLLHHLLAG